MDLIINDQLDLASLPVRSFMVESQVNLTTEHWLGSGLTGTNTFILEFCFLAPANIGKHYDCAGINAQYPCIGGCSYQTGLLTVLYTGHH